MRNELHGFPQEVIDKMLERQVEQGNVKDVTVFEQNCKVGGHMGFIWCETPEKGDFWEQVIDKRNFNLFFERYPKKSVYPKVMLVDDYNILNSEKWVPRVVFMEKLGRYYAWTCATTIEEAEKEPNVTMWKYAKDLPEVEPVKEYTLEEIAKALGKPVESIRIKK